MNWFNIKKKTQRKVNRLFNLDTSQSHQKPLGLIRTLHITHIGHYTWGWLTLRTSSRTKNSFWKSDWTNCTTLKFCKAIEQTAAFKNVLTRWILHFWNALETETAFALCLFGKKHSTSSWHVVPLPIEEQLLLPLRNMSNDSFTWALNKNEFLSIHQDGIQKPLYSLQT